MKKKLKKIMKLLTISVLILFISFNSCKSNLKKVETQKDNLQPQNFISEKLLLDSLSNSFRTLNRDEVNKIWNNILIQKNAIIEYLYTFQNKNESSNWYWIDLKSSRLAVREYHIPDQETAALFLITAIYYNDISFASSRYLYNDTIVKISSDGSISDESLASKNIDKKNLWKLIFENKNKNIRPFGKSTIFWVGEKGGKIDRTNFKKSFWYFYGYFHEKVNWAA